MSQIKTFICYSRANGEFVLKLAKDLKKAGCNVWMDKLDIPTGVRWDDEIEKTLNQCQNLLVVLSAASINSQNVKDEVGFAIDSNKNILPILIEPCAIPLRLRRFQYVDFSTLSYKEGLRLLENLIKTEAQVPEKEVLSAEAPVNNKSTPAVEPIQSKPEIITEPPVRPEPEPVKLSKVVAPKLKVARLPLKLPSFPFRKNWGLPGNVLLVGVIWSLSRAIAEAAPRLAGWKTIDFFNSFWGSLLVLGFISSVFSLGYCFGIWNLLKNKNVIIVGKDRYLLFIGWLLSYLIVYTVGPLILWRIPLGSNSTAGRYAVYAIASIACGLTTGYFIHRSGKLFSKANFIALAGGFCLANLLENFIFDQVSGYVTGELVGSIRFMMEHSLMTVRILGRIYEYGLVSILSAFSAGIVAAGILLSQLREKS